MDHSSTARKNLRDLSNPMELRELNRQMEWIWRKILGGLTAKDFSDSGVRGVVNVVEKTVAETIKADEVTTNILKTALAEMMVAQIGVAKIDYANIVDAFAERIFTDTGLAGKFRANGLEVTSAQIVDLIVNSFRLVGTDGKVYKVSIDASGNLTTEYLSDEDALFSDGKIPDGYSAVSSSLTVGDVTAGKLYVAGAADIMKLTAKYLSADEAFIRELTSDEAFITCLETNQAFITMLYTSAIYGGKSLKMIVSELEGNALYDSATPPTAAETGQKWIDRGVSPSAFRRWKGLTTTPAGATMTTAREVEETVNGTSVSLDNSGGQINSALAVSVRGKNLLDIYALCNGISYVQGGTIGKWPENGGFDLTATANDCYTEPWNGANYNIPVKPNTTYTLSWDIYIVPNTGTSAVMWFIDHRFEAGYYGQAFYDAHFVTFTTPSDAQTVSFRFGVQNSGESVGYTNLQLEEGDARTAFCAYKTAATVTHNGTVYTLPLSNDADHDAAVEIEPLSGTNTISTAADAMEVVYTCSGWETIGDMSALQKTVDAQTLQAAALENAMNETSRLAEETAANFKRVIEIQSGADGGLIVGDNLSNCSIKIKSASIELRVGNTAVATYAQDYVRLQDMQIRVPAGVGGLVLSKFDKE